MGVDTMYLFISPTATTANFAERRADLAAFLGDGDFSISNEGLLSAWSYARWPTEYSQYRASGNSQEARFIQAGIAAVLPDAEVFAIPDAAEYDDSVTAAQLRSLGAMELSKFIDLVEMWAKADASTENTSAFMTSKLNPDIVIPLSWFRLEECDSFQATFAGHSHTNRFELNEWDIDET